MSTSTGRLPRIALVTHSLALGGGVGTMTAFLHRVLTESGRYHPEVISLAMSSMDPASVQLRAPDTWRHGPLVQSGEWCGLPYRHVGAYFVELECQRYRPRPVLDDLLADYDLVQFIVGIPSWSCVAEGARQPCLLWTATTVWPDRASRVREAPLPRRWWYLLMTQIARAYEKRALRQVHFVFALSQYTLDTIKDLVTPGHAGLAACGVDTVLFRPSNQSRSNYILCVARFSDPRKNVRLLIQAYVQLAARLASLPDLYLVGQLPSGRTLQWIGELDLTDRVHFLGPRYGPELAELYRNAQFFVLSSDEEGLGIIVLEAMASGLPVVSTRCGGPEMAVVEGETGFLTPVGDAQALAVAMQRLLDDAVLRRHMGHAGRQVAEERFSLAATGQVFLSKYDELLGS